MLIRVMLCFLGKVEGVSRGIAVHEKQKGFKNFFRSGPVLAPPCHEQAKNSWKGQFQISTTIQIQQTFLKMFHTKQKYYKIFLDKSAKNVCSKNLKKFSLEKPNGFKKLTIFIFDLFFILLHFIFSRFQLLQSVLCQWSRRLLLNSSKKIL